MKKLLILTLCITMMLSMTACGSHSSVTSQKTSANSKEVSAKETSSTEETQIPLPFTDCATLDEAAKIAGFSLSVPDQIQGCQNRHILAGNGLFEVIYTNDNEGGTDFEAKDFCIRKGTDSGDISGDYTEYSEINTISVDKIRVTTKGDNGKIKVALWTDDGYSYSIGAGNGITSDALQKLIKSIQ